MRTIVSDDASLEESPKPEVYAVTIYEEMFVLWKDGTISAEELLLLVQIHALSRKPRGCWATNSWLANWGQLKSKGHVSRMIGKLLSLELIRAEYHLCENGGKERRLFSMFRVVRDGTQICSHPYTSMQSPLRIDVKELVYKLNTKKKRLPAQGAIAPSPNERVVFFCAKKLLAFLRERKEIPKSETVQDFAKQINYMLQYDYPGEPDRILNVTRFYVENPNHKFRSPVNSAKDFRKKFLKIENRMKQIDPPKPKAEFEIE